MESRKLLKVNDLKIKLGDEDMVDITSSVSVTPKNPPRISNHVESTISYQDPMKPRLSNQDTAIKRHMGRQSALIDQILSAGSYKNRQDSNQRSGYKSLGKNLQN